MNEAIDWIREIETKQQDIITYRRHFHRHPELGLKEHKTSMYIKRELERMGISYEEVEPTGIVASIGKEESDKVIAIRADMDALKMKERTDVSYQSENDGVMHACGHDGHMAALLGACSVLKQLEEQLSIMVKVIFQPSEENCKGAKLMIESGLLDKVQEIFGLHIFADIPAGKVSVEKGPRMAATDQFTINIKGKSGHAGKPHQCVDAVVVVAAIVSGLQTIISRQLDPLHSAVVSIGHMEAGTQYNIVAGSGRLDGTVRSFSIEDSLLIEKAIKKMVKSIAESFGANGEVSYYRAHPAVINNEGVTENVLAGVKKISKEQDLISIPRMFLGEDFANYLKKIPGSFAFIGAGNKEKNCIFPNHHDQFNLDESILIDCTKLYVAYVMEMNDQSQCENV